MNPRGRYSQMAQIQSISKHKTNHRFFTIGYEGLSVEDFFTKLAAAGVSCLIDVRRNPISRKQGFSKKALNSFCHEHDIIYYHYPNLGIPSDKRRNIKSKDDYYYLFKYYRESILPEVDQEVDDLANICTSAATALLCFESDPEFCHRSCLAQELLNRLDYRVVHL
jgi:uncharacterized protein (DUF488 family)